MSNAGAAKCDVEAADAAPQLQPSSQKIVAAKPAPLARIALAKLAVPKRSPAEATPATVARDVRAKDMSLPKVVIAEAPAPAEELATIVRESVASISAVELSKDSRRAWPAVAALVAAAVVGGVVATSGGSFARERDASHATAAAAVAATALPAHAPSSEPPAAPAAAAVAAPAEASVVAPVAPQASTGVVKTATSTPGRRIFVEQRTVGQTPEAVVVSCGSHRVRIGSTGRTLAVDVPCGGEISVSDR